MRLLVKIRFSGRLLAFSIAPFLLANGVEAQQPYSSDFNQKYEVEVSKARAECSNLWSNHVFDPFRTKLNLSEEKPTFLMLKNTEKLNRKDRPLADLAIKTLDQCRRAYEPVYAMLPPQVRGRIEAIQRLQDAKVAELYNGKTTFGDFNVAISQKTADLVTAFSGILQPPKADPVASVSTDGSKPKTDAVPSESRIALVIGNSSYSSLPKLPNPANDARAVAEIVKAMGYNVHLLIDGSEQGIRREVRQFASDSEKADVALVFYAGHGAQVNGNNYLLPTDMDIPRTEVDIQFSSLKVDDLVNSISSNTKIVFLDACRDNPVLFKNIVKGRGSSPAGLAPAASSNLEQKPGSGIFIAYATDAGAVASDGSGKHSPFTQALLRNMQKPISIDDMFSLVTKEVRLVTKNAQRPYKYASLENIICVAPNCSSSAISSSSIPDRISPVEEAQRSEDEDFQAARGSNKILALETFLEKYPDTLKQAEVQNIIDNLKRAEFTEWTLYEIGNKTIPWYVRLSSIQHLQDRAAIAVRNQIDPASPKIFFGKPFPDAEFAEDVNAYDCVKPSVATSEETIFDKSGNTLYHYKFADPRYLDLSVGAAVTSGSVGSSIRNLACNEDLGTPIIGKDRLTKMNFESLSSTIAGDGDIFFETLREISPNEKSFLFIIRFYSDKKISFGPIQLADLPDYRTSVEKGRLLCAEKKMSVTRSEYYDVSNNLVYLHLNDTSSNPKWIEIKDGMQSPVSALYRMFCKSGEATK
jgi:hypothetical protein